MNITEGFPISLFILNYQVCNLCCLRQTYFRYETFSFMTRYYLEFFIEIVQDQVYIHNHKIFNF